MTNLRRLGDVAQWILNVLIAGRPLAWRQLACDGRGGVGRAPLPRKPAAGAGDERASEGCTASEVNAKKRGHTHSCGEEVCYEYLPPTAWSLDGGTARPSSLTRMALRSTSYTGPYEPRIRIRASYGNVYEARMGGDAVPIVRGSYTRLVSRACISAHLFRFEAESGQPCWMA